MYFYFYETCFLICVNHVPQFKDAQKNNADRTVKKKKKVVGK